MIAIHRPVGTIAAWLCAPPLMVGAAGLICLLLASSVEAEKRPRTLDYYKLAPGFVAEKKNEVGFAVGYSAPNPWGEYTAYLMTTNDMGQRTWRIEQYQELPGAGFWQGSSMYLLEGSERALLIDTAQPSKSTPGVNDLKSVVRHLLGHENDGGIRTKPLDFVVANTHDHPDHIGENAQMADRTVYYMDGDWPTQAPANYVPIREGGGPTNNGSGTAVGMIDLGDRQIRALALPPHTRGSLAYLDRANGLLISGDAMGSGWPWLHWADISTYAASMDRVAATTRDMPGLAVLPAHFYQIEAYGRRDGPLGQQYLRDQLESAKGILNGQIKGEPYYLIGPEVYWGGIGSAKLTYSLDRIDAPNLEPVANYRAVRIPGRYWKSEWVRDSQQQKLFNIHSELHLIRSAQGDVLFLLGGSSDALLIGTGSGQSGLASFVSELAQRRALKIVTLLNTPSQTGGAEQLQPNPVLKLRDGLMLDLGTDGSGRPLRVEAYATGNAFTLLSVTDRVLFASDAAAIRSAPESWRKKVRGRYDLVFLASSARWFTSLDELSPE